MSDVELFWDAIRAKWPHPVAEFKNLPPNAQERIIMGINYILSVLPGDL